MAVLCSAAQGFRPDYLYLLQRLCMDNPEGAVNLAKTVAKQPGPPIDLNTMADLFLQRNMVREATAFLLDVLQDNDPRARQAADQGDSPTHPPLIHACYDLSLLYAKFRSSLCILGHSADIYAVLRSCLRSI